MVSNKRDLSDLEEGETSEPSSYSNKRPKQQQQQQSSKSRQHQNSGIDPTWGQKYVFSSCHDATTIPAGEESDFEDDADAMAYLMSVRQEAYGIPHLLVAPKVQIGPQLPADAQNIVHAVDNDGEGENDDEHDVTSAQSPYVNGLGDSRGWYEDGAYMAAPNPEGSSYDQRADDVSDDADEASGKAIHDAYIASLLDQYTHLRATLHAPPPSDAYSRLPSSTPIDAAPFGRNSPTTSIWSQRLRNADPIPLQLALMSKDSVLRVIRVLLGGKLLQPGHSVAERTSRWLWALLARLPDRGELNHAEIGWIRDLGRRAVLLSRSLAEMAALREELATEGGLGMDEDVDGYSSNDDEPVVAADAEGGDGLSDQTQTDPTAPVSDNVDSAAESKPPPPDEDPDYEDGEIAEEEEKDEDIAMELESTSSVEEGEAADDGQDDLEDAKARLLAQLDASAAEERQRVAAEEARERSRMNMRATVNMILTVAGEFYGQRDLLEFREPFVGM